MDTKKLRQKILDLAIKGKLVSQDPNDEPASVLLERIRDEKERLIAEGKIKSLGAQTSPALGTLRKTMCSQHFPLILHFEGWRFVQGKAQNGFRIKCSH